jgi:hypothetical protein
MQTKFKFQASEKNTEGSAFIFETVASHRDDENGSNRKTEDIACGAS